MEDAWSRILILSFRSYLPSPTRLPWLNVWLIGTPACTRPFPLRNPGVVENTEVKVDTIGTGYYWSVFNYT